MQYHYDLYGWYTGQAIPGRATDIEPQTLSETTVVGELRANFTGYEWRVTPYINPPPLPDAAPDDRAADLPRVTRLAFRNRFTQAEKVALELAALDDPAATMAQRQQSAAIRVYLADVAAATFVDLGRDDTRAGVQALEAGGLIGAGRALEILNAPVEVHERPAL